MNTLRIFGRWLWIGIVVGILNSIAGLLVGITLMTQREYRWQGIIVALWAIGFYLAAPYISLWIFNHYNVAFSPVPVTTVPWLTWLPMQ